MNTADQYLKSIYLLQQAEDGPASTGAIAWRRWRARSPIATWIRTRPPTTSSRPCRRDRRLRDRPAGEATRTPPTQRAQSPATSRISSSSRMRCSADDYDARTAALHRIRDELEILKVAGD